MLATPPPMEPLSRTFCRLDSRRSSERYMDVYTLLQTQHTCGTPRDDTTCARKPSMKCTGDRAEVAATPRLRKQANQGSHRRAVHPGTPQSPSPLGNTGDGCLCTRPQRPATTQSPGMDFGDTVNANSLLHDVVVTRKQPSSDRYSSLTFISFSGDQSHHKNLHKRSPRSQES